ncbi:MAG: helix-turn-helix domain-containing protein [Clostridiales bacterium]|nr:helix-turn-helix domain-containing protein [Clostridiales bacterium]
MIEINIKELGERIKDLRTELGLSQKQLADKIGAAANTVSQYESGKSRTSIDVLANLAVALDTTTDYLLGLEH